MSTETIPQAEPTLVAEQLPIFVYGTLRPGHGLARVWQHRGHARYDGEARLRGFRLVSGGAFPFALPDGGKDAFAVGTLIFPDADQYDAVLERMDAIEGVPHFYDRLMVVVQLPEHPVKAWVYSPVNPAGYADLPAVPGNDWNQEVGR